MRKLLVVVSVAAVAVTAFAVVPAQSATRGVSVKDNFFSPKSLTVSRGSTVKWSWKGHTKHNVTFPTVHSTTKVSGVYSHKFNHKGTFSYVCTIHPGMTGK
ncbi:MAG: plastocyanin/azurin family copper-binding protein, partial [Solirubrobacteraceae bacterium]